MNSQQELLEAINTISQNRDKSFDTPATVLRVEGDTVWVHIDGGADETPVQRTINCAEGETVQVRISNGSAFLVGNASAPPTDDKTANVAHFVAEQADEKATEAIRSVNAIEQTVEEQYIASGDSNIHNMSSTMYQNANGVNIYNGTLASGDSYAHIDGDEFSIKKVTTAGVIDDANDKIRAKFGQTVQISEHVTQFGVEEGSDFIFNSQGLHLSNYYQGSSGGVSSHLYNDNLTFSLPSANAYTEYGYSSIYAGREKTGSWPRTSASIDFEHGNLYVSKEIRTGGGFKSPTVLESSTIAASDTTYTFTDDAITADSVIDVWDTIFGFAPSNIQTSAGSCTITFPAQSSSHTIKLFVY